MCIRDSLRIEGSRQNLLAAIVVREATPGDHELAARARVDLDSVVVLEIAVAVASWRSDLELAAHFRPRRGEALATQAASEVVLTPDDDEAAVISDRDLRVMRTIGVGGAGDE